MGITIPHKLTHVAFVEDATTEDLLKFAKSFLENPPVTFCNEGERLRWLVDVTNHIFQTVVVLSLDHPVPDDDDE